MCDSTLKRNLFVTDLNADPIGLDEQGRGQLLYGLFSSLLPEGILPVSGGVLYTRLQASADLP